MSRQSRKSLSISGELYQAMQNYIIVNGGNMSNHAENKLRELVGLPAREESRIVPKKKRENWQATNKKIKPAVQDDSDSSVIVEEKPAPSPIKQPRTAVAQIFPREKPVNTLRSDSNLAATRAERRAAIIKNQEERHRAIYGDKYLPQPVNNSKKKSAIGDVDLTEPEPRSGESDMIFG